jgi:hypothetical protein
MEPITNLEQPAEGYPEGAEHAGKQSCSLDVCRILTLISHRHVHALH